jgi:hypothetical protein
VGGEILVLQGQLKCASCLFFAFWKCDWIHMKLGLPNPTTVTDWENSGLTWPELRTHDLIELCTCELKAILLPEKLWLVRPAFGNEEEPHWWTGVVILSLRRIIPICVTAYRQNAGAFKASGERSMIYGVVALSSRSNVILLELIDQFKKTLFVDLHPPSGHPLAFKSTMHVG